MKGIAPSIVVSILVIAGAWVVGQILGFDVSLVTSIVLTIGLTLVVNFLLAAFRRREL